LHRFSPPPCGWRVLGGFGHRTSHGNRPEKALGAGSGTVGWFTCGGATSPRFVGGCLGYALGLLLARFPWNKIFGVPPAPSLLVLGVHLVLVRP